jgi:hypothetical protein
MKKQPIILFGLSMFLLTITLAGCGCTEHDCYRIKKRTEGINRYQNKLIEVNKDFAIEKLGKILPPYEQQVLLKRFCTKYEGTSLPPEVTDLARSKIGIDQYYIQKFCLAYYENPNLKIYEQEIQLDEQSGSIFYYLTDGKKVSDFLYSPLSYTKNGYRYGIADH